MGREASARDQRVKTSQSKVNAQICNDSSNGSNSSYRYATPERRRQGNDKLLRETRKTTLIPVFVEAL
jgi:hypothetical protein